MNLPNFGKFRNKDIEDVPDSYLVWLLETDWFDKKFPALVKPIDEELKYRNKFDKHIVEER